MTALRRAWSCQVEMWSALVAIGWSKWLYWPGRTLESTPVYQTAVQILDTDDWEALAFVVGCVQLAAVLHGNRWARSAGSGLAAWLWGCLGLAIALSPGNAPGAVLYFGWSLANAAAAVRLFTPRRAPPGCHTVGD